MRFIDINGEDGWDVALGCVTVAGGVAQWVGGVGLVATGAGGPAGVVLIISGSGTIALGTAQIIDGAANDGEHNVPGGFGELTAATAEKAFDMEGSGLREAGSLVDLGVGLTAGGVQKASIGGAIDITNTAVTAYGPAKFISNELNGKEFFESVSGKIQNAINSVEEYFNEIINKTMNPVEELDPTEEALREHLRNGSLY